MTVKQRGLTLLELMFIFGVIGLISAFALLVVSSSDGAHAYEEQSDDEDIDESDVYIDFDTDAQGNTRSVEKSRRTGLPVVRTSTGKYMSTKTSSGSRTSPASRPSPSPSPKTSPVSAPRSSPSPSPGVRR